MEIKNSMTSSKVKNAAGKTQLKPSMAHINFDADKLTAADVDQAIAMLGYQANKVAADPEAYAALPDCCKVPE